MLKRVFQIAFVAVVALLGFAASANADPHVYSINPNIGNVAGGDTVTITGEGFLDEEIETVTFGGERRFSPLIRTSS